MLGRTLIGLSETLIDDCCEEMFDIGQSSLVGFEEFQLLYFELFNKVQMMSGGSIDFENLVLNDEGAQYSNRHLKANENGTFLQTENTIYEDAMLAEDNSHSFTGK